MKILAIETSCDDTGIAILEIKGSKNPSFNVLSNIVSSQIEVHKKYGGVYPMLAKREHQKNLVPVLMRGLKWAKLLNPKSQIPNPKKILNSKFKILNSILEREPELYKKLILFLKKYDKPDINLISVTNGPGLEPCLWVGVNFAKCLSYFWNIPIVPVNHIESHVLVNLLPQINENSKSQIQISKQIPNPNFKNLFPAICLVVSGGHTQLILMSDIRKYKILGETRDDAAGECFDKCAKILGLGYPGGPAIAEFAQQWKSEARNSKSEIPTGSRGSSTAVGTSSKFQILNSELPRPMINSKDYDFSFSGLKTAVLYSYKKSNIKNKKYIKKMAAEIQQAIIDVLIKKTIRAAKDYKAKSIILGGGVSANCELRSQFVSSIKYQVSGVNFLVPPSNLSTDNALMTAITGFYHQKNTKNWRRIEANGNLRIGK